MAPASPPLAPPLETKVLAISLEFRQQIRCRKVGEKDPDSES